MPPVIFEKNRNLKITMCSLPGRKDWCSASQAFARRPLEWGALRGNLWLCGAARGVTAGTPGSFGHTGLDLPHLLPRAPRCSPRSSPTVFLQVTASDAAEPIPAASVCLSV